VEERGVWVETERATLVYDRERLEAGNLIAGPAIINQIDATTVVNPGWTAQVDPVGSLVLGRAVPHA
jgi:N-methylhydantoinase A/oxoprolinase/acetone carboxylase beta subunit